ncbi:RluA family pseudouridine synthase [Claveliimonas bilis]|uniref:RNA pseudouridylate synthase n=1 Tax=Claveliimonas bilis TaxID=3028070 RepID=A0ABM8IAN3_9FIRM|nr:RluA family pseudouridine synthase [Claveliimonas bilis]BDZ77600.1 pseudouridine synthase [Claveliimonas bilis]
MREIVIGENEAGQRLDKFLAKYMKKAPKSFFYKMLRKKNIVLNGKKASGNEKLSIGDQVRLFLAEETIRGFSEAEELLEKKLSQKKGTLEKSQIIYEDKDILLINKPAGILSQRADTKEESLVEWILRYLLSTGALSKEDLRTFRPSVCNRLDRNTSGLIAAGKSLAGLQVLSRLFKERDLKKYYRCIVSGKIGTGDHIKGYLSKDERTNKVTISERPLKEGDAWIETSYRPLSMTDGATYLEVHLITGRPHQIRAHLASIGHPLIGDYKYGSRKVNEEYRRKYGLDSQLLHACRLEFPQMEGRLGHLSKQIFEAPIPPVFEKILKEEGLA